jgi:protein-disulfide isomerase
LLVAITGCSRQVTGTAAPDPRKPGVVLSDDGYGIVAGFDNAPVKVEIFTEPQCTHCADLQADFGDDIGRYINLGQLAVTYRPLTFLDLAPDGHSARVSNAMFLAADPAASATSLQAFVQALWASQARFGEGPSDDEIADLARMAGLPGEVVDRIAAGESALDVEEMADTNFAFLFDADPLDTGTPTVYDAEKGEIIEIYDNNWLSKLMASA